MGLWVFFLPLTPSGKMVTPWFWFQPTTAPSNSSSLTLSGIKEDNSLLNQGFLQAKPEKAAVAQKPRSHFLTPAPVSAGHPWASCSACLLSSGPLHRLFLCLGALPVISHGYVCLTYSLISVSMLLPQGEAFPDPTYCRDTPILPFSLL